MKHFRVNRREGDSSIFDRIHLRTVLGKDDDYSMIWNWAIKQLRKEIEQSSFSPMSVTEKFIGRMNLYSVNDPDSWKWCICKDAGEYVMDAIISVNEDKRHREPQIVHTEWVY